MTETQQQDEFAKGMTCWSEAEDQKIENYTRWQADLIVPFLGKRVLEVGAGAGRFTRLLTQQKNYECYVAMEPSTYFFPKLKRCCPGLQALNCTIEELDVAWHGTFDTVILIHVLEHIEDDEKFLKALDLFLKSGGKIINMVPAFNWLKSQLDVNIGHFRRYDKKMTRHLGQMLNYRILINRYDNLIGILGWLWVCKIKKVHYQAPVQKQTLFKYFSFFDKHVLPFISSIEKVCPPLVGLNLTTVYEKL